MTKKMTPPTDTETQTETTDSPMGVMPRLEWAQANGLAWEQSNMPNLLEAQAFTAAMICYDANFTLDIKEVFGNGESFKKYGKPSYNFDPVFERSNEVSQKGME